MNPPKPTALKLLEGNPGKRPINQDEPRPAPKIPESPDHLDEKAEKIWNLMAPQLHKLGLLTEIDGPALSALCQLLSDWQRLERNLRYEGLFRRVYAISPATGKKVLLAEKTNPKVIMKRETLKLLRSFLDEFGMTPSSRTRIRLTPEVEDEEMERLLTRVK